MTSTGTAAHLPLPLRRRLAIGLLLAPLAKPAACQSPPQSDAASAPAQEPLAAELLKTGLYLITGGGGHSLLRLSAAGAILVGGKRPGAYRPLMSQIRRINRLSDLPLRVVIYPDHREPHAGNHDLFIAASVAVIAQANALRRLAAASPSPLPASAASSLPRRAPGPTFGFDREHEFRMGGVEVRLHHFGPAQCDNDTVVLFPDMKVLALGHLVTAGLPWPDFAAGGSLAGWGPALEQVLKLDFELAVPSAGPPLTRADVAAFKERVESLTARAVAIVKAGTPKERFVAQFRTDDHGGPFEPTAQALDQLYSELARSGP